MTILSSKASRSIHGGLSLPRHKPGLPSDGHIPRLALPDQLIIPLLDYHKNILRPLVETGQYIRLGQAVAKGIIAPASGVVQSLSPRAIIHPSQKHALCATLTVDRAAQESLESAVHAPLDLLTEQRLEQCAIVGLGGAGFSTAQKLAGRAIHTLVINAVECEPGISCDESLLISDAHGVVQAIHALIQFSQCQRCVIATEDDKPEALEALRAALAEMQWQQAVKPELLQLQPVYPTGAERPLIQRITGQKIPYPKKPVNLGIACLNVATVYAAGRARRGLPLVSRILTISGSKARNPCNVHVRLGTRVADVLQQTGNAPDRQTQVRAGGPLSGFELLHTDAPVCATSNCLSLEAVAPKPQPQPCIRCGECSKVCPVKLLPQQLFWYTENDELDNAERFGLSSCIECGCCDVVCPSSISLTQLFRYGKSAAADKSRQTTEAETARQRYQLREERLAAVESIKQQKRQEAQKRLTEGSSAITDALQRARERRRHSKPDTDNRP
ncbi:MAG: electron transport complex subunit RsxC [Granulosicoccus sp.]